ncbi:MAG TPA: C1 family peptidase, partial [Methylomirabilota bacterium]|nr:C1 family peptidase [Methylomirabilota bacterium]
WKYEDAVAAGALGAVAALPPSVDLRQSWWTVGDQGQTGSCVGWASADGVVRYHMVAAGKLKKNQLLSPRYVWMASKETDEYTLRPESFVEEAGTSLKGAMDVCRKFGVATLAMLPFRITTLMYTGGENPFYAAAAQLRVSSYFNLRKNLNQWQSWLAAHGPILAGLNVDQTWDNATTTKGNLDTPLPKTARGGHAIAVVGYTSTGRFIVRNSWGPAWGDNGFAYASPAYITGAFFDESYGVTI